MARGGGTVAGSKKSVANSSSSSSTHVSSGGGGDLDPKFMFIGLCIFGVIFMILTIVIPVAMVADPAGNSCVAGGLSNLNRNEQIFCKIPDLDEDYVAAVVGEGSSDNAKIYKVEAAKQKLVNRSMYWIDYTTKLKGSYDYFSFSVPVNVSGFLDVRCGKDNIHDTRGDKCGKVMMYLMTEAEFNAAVDENDEFHEPDCKENKCWDGFKKQDEYHFNWYAIGPNTFYLVFSLEKDKKTKLQYDIYMNYFVYDTAGETAQDIVKGEVEFKSKDLKEGDVIIIDFPYDQGETNYSDKTAKDLLLPEYFEGYIHDLDINWSGVIAVAIIFGLITLVCFGLAALFGYKFLKKIGKIGKKAIKKMEKLEEKHEEAQMEAVAQPAQPGYDPNMAYAAQPVDPAYAAQPYPGQM